ncbi:MAG: rhodanese-like domain-containing protein [Verrucomicrobia bacterium]|nr:rhodanese-like domain-containing protein [Verrucomicrobiota bacterium]MDA1067334.1 rhodanese-like domain-containing protein [Verrucomicrobiota bacterium]
MVRLSHNFKVVFSLLNSVPILISFSVLLVFSVGLLLWFKLIGRVSDQQVKDYLAAGALVVDVRPPKRYAQKHLAGVENVSALSIGKSIGRLSGDKARIILCHCESGGLSAIAVHRLRKAGYKQSFNLGSYKRAASLLEPNL